MSHRGALYGTLAGTTGLKIGYARVSTVGQDLTAQRDGLAALGVDAERVYVDHGLIGTNRARPGLDQALAAVRTGDTLAVPKLDRLARSVPDARDIVEELTGRGVRLQLGGSVHDPTDPVGRLLFNVLAMVAEFSVIWTRRGPHHEGDHALAQALHHTAAVPHPGRRTPDPDGLTNIEASRGFRRLWCVPDSAESDCWILGS